MTDYFPREAARLRSEMQDIALGAGAGTEAVAFFIRYVLEPTSFAEYAPAVGGTVVGALVVAGFISRRPPRF